MKKLFVPFALLLAFSLAAFAQGSGRLSADDQREFDKHYTKWVNDTRKNDRDDIAKDVRKMQEIMARYNIPANVPYEQIASSGNAYPARSYQARLSPDEQREFDKHYTKWVNDRRKNDRDDIAKDERHMQEIMGRNNIPPNVPFDQVASTGYANGAAAYPSNGPWQGRLSADDQREFDRYYSRWVEDNRSNDRDDVAKDAGHMQEIMARYNIPANVPFDQLASRGAYPNENSPSGAYPAVGQTRLSPDDQREFDKYYAKWVDDTRKNDRDDIDKDTRHMQDIMGRYNIPVNVPFDQIATPGAASRY